MITCQLLSEISSEDFERLFLASLPAMEDGTLPWEFVGSPQTQDEKLEAVRQRFLKFCGVPSSKVVAWYIDGVAVHISAGSINPNKPDELIWSFGVYGPDGNGSRSWLYSTEYLEACRTFLNGTLGLSGFAISAVTDSSLYNYYLTRPDAHLFYDVWAEPLTDGTSLIHHTYN